MTAEADLRRYRDEAGRHRQAISRTSAEIASKRKKAADASTAASRSTNASTIRMRLTEAERATKDANTAETKRADLEKKLADVEAKISKTQERYEKEQREAQARALESIRSQNTLASRQFGWPTQHQARVGSFYTRTPSQAQASSYDVFLSHASEDKETIARPLMEALEERGLTVWFDEIQIKLGQSIRQEIERGIANARFGVVIVSPNFFNKQWTQAELDGLFSRKMESGDNSILPVWHHVSKDEVMAASPLLAGILALNSSLQTVAEMAEKIAGVVQS